MQKNLGQHFLHNSDIARSIALAVPTEKNETILEIGPGEGILTEALLATGCDVLAIEKDAALIPVLEKRFATALATGQLQLLHEDIRNMEAVLNALQNTNTPSQSSPIVEGEAPQPQQKYQIVANIPYYITGQIIRQFLTCARQPTSMTLLLQKEVAERICSRNGKESILSLSVAAYGEPQYIRTVKAGSFSPPPKVDSAVLTIEHISRRNFIHARHEAQFFTILHTAFTGKRKMLRATLKDIATEAQLHSCDIAPTSRPETVSLEQWLCLAECLAPHDTAKK